MELDVGDGGTLGALGVRSGGNVLGEERDSDWRVDASDVDTDISSRLNMYNIYSYSYLLVCLSDAGSSSPHACSTSLSRAGMWEVTPNSLTFSSSWTKFLCFLFLVFRQLRAGRGRAFSFSARVSRAWLWRGTRHPPLRTSPSLRTCGCRYDDVSLAVGEEC